MRTHIKLTVDGETLMDGDLGEWKHKPPTAIQHLIKPGRKPEPYLQAALGAVLEASLISKSATIDCTTRENGWTVSVDHEPKPVWAK